MAHTKTSGQRKLRALARKSEEGSAASTLTGTSAPFVPAAADRVTVGVHGSFSLPWPVLRHFTRTVEASGDIVDAAPAATGPQPGRDVERVGDSGSAGQPALGKTARVQAKHLWAVQPASNPTPPDHGSGDVELVLVAPAPAPIALIRKIRQITGFGLLDSRALLAACPSVVVTGLSESRAGEPQDALRSAGATVDVRPR